MHLRSYVEPLLSIAPLELRISRCGGGEEQAGVRAEERGFIKKGGAFVHARRTSGAELRQASQLLQQIDLSLHQICVRSIDTFPRPSLLPSAFASRTIS
jgi:hypothetical protein